MGVVYVLNCPLASLATKRWVVVVLIVASTAAVIVVEANETAVAHTVAAHLQAVTGRWLAESHTRVVDPSVAVDLTIAGTLVDTAPTQGMSSSFSSHNISSWVHQKNPVGTPQFRSRICSVCNRTAEAAGNVLLFILCAVYFIL